MSDLSQDVSPRSRRAVRPITVFVVLASWAVGNVLLAYALNWYESAPKSGDRVISHLARTRFQRSLYQGDEVTLPVRMMPPQAVRRGQLYPLLVFLHGAGECGSENLSQLSGLPEQLAEKSWSTQFPCFVLAPQCPRGRHWNQLVVELRALIHNSIGKHPIDPDRIYLTGLSMGGFGSWALVASEPELFAAVVPICGGGEVTAAKCFVKVPLWAVHGDADTTISVEYSRKMIAALREAGGQPRYTELKGVGHNSWTETYRDPDGVLKWMFEQRNPRGDQVPSE
jgi:predicted peptidase